MNVVFLCPNVPFPPVNGGQHRSLRLIRSLARFASVRVLAIGDPRAEGVGPAQAALAAEGVPLEVYPPEGPGAPEADEELEERRPDAAAHFRSPELAAALRAQLVSGGVDLVHVEEVVMAQYVEGLPGAQVIDRQKVDWAYHEAMAHVAPAGPGRAHLREAARFRWWERQLVGTFDRMFVPGAGDQALLEPLHGPGLVHLVPIGIGDEFAPPEGSRRVDHVLLYGALDYGPNVEGQEWFFRDVWPALREAAPGLKVKIVGSGRPPLSAPRPPGDGRVEMHGFVDDVRAVLQGPGVLVVPVRVGGGARTKVLEALASGMPVVSTTAGIENLDLVPGRECLVADGAEQMVEALSALSRDEERAAALGRAGAARVEAFRWSRIETRLEPLYREALAEGGRIRARSRAHARDADWSVPADVARLRAERIEAHDGSPGARRALGRALRRARRSSLVRRAEAATLRLLDRWLTPKPRPG